MIRDIARYDHNPEFIQNWLVNLASAETVELRLKYLAAIGIAASQSDKKLSLDLKRIKLSNEETSLLVNNNASSEIYGLRESIFCNPFVSHETKRKIERTTGGLYASTLTDLVKKSPFDQKFNNSSLGDLRSLSSAREFQHLFSKVQKTKNSPKKGSALITVCMSHKDNFNLLSNVAIPSLVNQTEPAFICYVVDDYSADEQLWESTVKKFDHDKRFIFLRNQSSVGTYLIRNFCLKNAQTEFFCVADSDDYQVPKRLEHQLALAKLSWFCSQQLDKINKKPKASSAPRWIDSRNSN